MKPLEGIKVVELSTMLAGPMCARVLAEWGADVIKVETLNGDAWRKQAGTTLSPCTPDANPNFDMQNLNKRFVSLNLRTEGGQEAMMKLLEGADMVFSGEGKLDAQSLLGKVVIGVARRAKRAGVPLVAVVGDIGDNIEAAYDMGVSAVFSINRVAVPFREAKPRSKSDLALTMDNLMRFCRRMGW